MPFFLPPAAFKAVSPLLQAYAWLRGVGTFETLSQVYLS